MNHLISLAGIGLLAGLLPAQAQRKSVIKHQQPNIILFLVDDMGWQDTSVPFWTQRTPFNDRYHTPNMVRMAKLGVKFTQAYACPVSSPSRVSLLTGMNAARHRVTNWTLEKNTSTDAKDPDLIFPIWNVNGITPTPSVERAVYATTLPMLLQKAGYTTIHCGKAHFGAKDTPGEEPKNLGFDINIAGHAAGGPATYQGLKNFGNDDLGQPTSVWSIPGLKKYHGKDINLTEALTIEALHAVDSVRNNGNPFFLYMSHYAVHAPIEANNQFIKNYENSGLDKTEAKYASMIEGMDKSLGDIMDYLERNNLEKNTIILFMSDNGGLSAVARGGEPHTHNRPLASGKGSAYEGGIREPMMLIWPDVAKPNSICDKYLIIEDFFPSILQMAGLKKFNTVQIIDGISFIPFLNDKSDPSKNRPLFWHYPNRWGETGPGIGTFSSVRLNDWKLIYYHTSQKIELFNITNDISETKNLADKEQTMVKKLSKVLGEYLRKVNAQMPMNKHTGKAVPYPDQM
ncbi:MAG: sulfatase [Bacteroidetes bacterium]|nr:sulfatase [Bacteroidota bacterium]